MKRRSSSVMTATSNMQLPPPPPTPIYSNRNVAAKVAGAGSKSTLTQTTATPPNPHQLSNINGMYIRDEIGVQFFRDVLGSAEMINKTFTPVRIVKRSDSYEYAGVLSGGGSHQRQARAAPNNVDDGPIQAMSGGFVHHDEQPPHLDTQQPNNPLLLPSHLHFDDDDEFIVTSDYDAIESTNSPPLFDDDEEEEEEDELNRAAVIEPLNESGESTTRTVETYRTASDQLANEYMHIVDDELRQLNLLETDQKKETTQT